MDYKVAFIIGGLEADDYPDRNLELKKDVEKPLR